ncbi:MAG: hypothetical protein HZA92_17145 [Verrucomicrobia bacterium]|nr:hypothetical protein [Verrucomicrobiota bacterium]
MKSTLLHWAVTTAICLGAPALTPAASLDTPTHKEVEPIRIPIGPEGLVKTIAMDVKGNLLVGVSWAADEAKPAPAAVPPPGGPGRRGDVRQNDPNARGGINPALAIDREGHTYALKVVSPDGKVLATWPMTGGLQPKMIFGSEEGAVYVAGGGRLAQFTADGKLVQMLDTDQLYGQKGQAAGLCADASHVYLALGMGNSLRATEDFIRFKRDLSEPKTIVERQYGCCNHIDLRVAKGELLIAENSRHRVNRFDLDGKPLGTWGRRDRESLSGFVACCNPCNFDFGPGGVLYTAESGVGRVKKYAQDGTFLGLVGYVDTTKFDQGSQLAAQSCYIPIEVNHDASRIYVMDVRAAIIRVLAKLN